MSSIIQDNLATEFQACINLYQQENFQEAFVRIQNLLFANPESIDIKYVTAICSLALNHLDEAEKLLTECIQVVTNNAELFCNYALVFDKKGNTEKAIEAYKSSLSIDPNNIASLADLALDTRIYNGGTVTSQTLWAGVPVLTLMGGHFASRMASSIVSNVGMAEMITNTPEEYEELAIKIATTQGESVRLKKKLAKNKLTAPLFNTAQFTKDIEGLYKHALDNFERNVK